MNEYQCLDCGWTGDEMELKTFMYEDETGKGIHEDVGCPDCRSRNLKKIER